MALAKYLASRATSLEVNLVRSGPGKYTFGTRQVNINLDGGALVASFEDKRMSLEDFLDGYSLIETEKLNKLEEEKRNSPRRASPVGKDRRGAVKSAK